MFYSEPWAFCIDHPQFSSHTSSQKGLSLWFYWIRGNSLPAAHKSHLVHLAKNSIQPNLSVKASLCPCHTGGTNSPLKSGQQYHFIFALLWCVYFIRAVFKEFDAADGNVLANQIWSTWAQCSYRTYSLNPSGRYECCLCLQPLFGLVRILVLFLHLKTPYTFFHIHLHIHICWHLLVCGPGCDINYFFSPRLASVHINCTVQIGSDGGKLLLQYYWSYFCWDTAVSLLPTLQLCLSTAFYDHHNHYSNFFFKLYYTPCTADEYLHHHYCDYPNR